MYGMFITFEGGEGAGKTTLIQEVFKQLVQEGREVIKTREPGGTQIGEQIRSILLHHTGPVSPFAELSLFLASRAQHVLETIRPALKERKIVLCDRFNDSTIAYQGAARGLGMEKVADFCKFVCDGVEPHLTFYLDIDPQVGLTRAKKNRQQDRIEAEDLAFHTKIRKAYLDIARGHPNRFHLIDATLSPNEVFDQAIGLIHSSFRR